jgi:hypothetical protein
VRFNEPTAARTPERERAPKKCPLGLLVRQLHIHTARPASGSYQSNPLLLLLLKLDPQSIELEESIEPKVSVVVPKLGVWLTLSAAH